MVYVLALTLVMYNCKKDEPFPTEPDSELVDEINAITVTPITLTQPAAVTTTPSTITASAKATEVAGAMGSLSSGTVPASVNTAAGEVTAALTPAEVTTLSTVTPATIAAVAAGGALPAELQTVMTKVAADPALAQYLPQFTLPTVNGAPVGGRSGAVEGIEEVEGVLVEDACVQAAAAVYEAVKVKLDAAKAAEDAKVAAAYSAAIAPLAAEQTSCASGIPAKYAALRAAGQAQAAQAMADIDAAQAVIPAALYPVLKALVNIQLLGYLTSLNTLQAADVAACAATLTAKTAAAAAARDADLAASTAAYQTALAAAQAKRIELGESCHNQGGGN